MLATFDMLLGKSYIRLHNGEHWYYDEEDELTQYFAVPLKYIAKKKSKKDVNLKEIYGVIAHELKTPLNVMKLYNEALMIGNVSEEKIERYNLIIKTQLELIVNQVHEFVDSNYVSRGIVHPKKESVDLVEVINKTLDKYSVIMEDKELTANIEGVDKAEFISDATGVRSIVSNYINNAIKYSMVAETINISVEKDERFAIIKIANKVPENLRYNTEDKDKKVINRIERDGLGLIIARTYLDICKASYGCNYADDNVEYWFKFRIK
jgi:signal transduction histidine kinase